MRRHGKWDYGAPGRLFRRRLPDQGGLVLLTHMHSGAMLWHGHQHATGPCKRRDARQRQEALRELQVARSVCRYLGAALPS